MAAPPSSIRAHPRASKTALPRKRDSVVNQHHELTPVDSTISIAFHADWHWDPLPLLTLMAGPWLGERVGGARMAAIAVGFLGVVIATRRGASAFQPIVFVAISGVFCNAAYGLTTRMLAGRDSAETTLVWTPLAGVIAMTPLLPWFWVTPREPLVWAIMVLMGASGAFGHGLMILAHQRAPASAMAPSSATPSCCG
jgi:drug/metabolite transporter (DMT)-like permease